MDPRLERIAADAAARGWTIRWRDTPERVELVVEPRVSNPHQDSPLEFSVAAALGGKRLVFWASEDWSGSLIEPWINAEDDPGIADESLFQTVENLEDCPSRGGQRRGGGASGSLHGCLQLALRFRSSCPRPED